MGNPDVVGAVAEASFLEAVRTLEAPAAPARELVNRICEIRAECRAAERLCGRMIAEMGSRTDLSPTELEALMDLRAMWATRI